MEPLEALRELAIEPASSLDQAAVDAKPGWAANEHRDDDAEIL